MGGRPSGLLLERRSWVCWVFIVASTINALAVFALTLMPRSAPWQALCLVISSLFDPGALVDAIVYNQTTGLDGGSIYIQVSCLVTV